MTTASHEVSIRLATPGDRDVLYEICLRTGDAGVDATALYADPEILGHVYVGPYAALEPDLAFVAEDEQGVGGYIVGALDTVAYDDRVEVEWYPSLRARYADPAAIAVDDRSPDQAIAALIHRPRRMPAAVTDQWPSHLHIDLLPRLQRRGVGRRLMDTLAAALIERGSTGVHLGVAGRNANGAAFQRHIGMDETFSGPDGSLFTRRF